MNCDEVKRAFEDVVAAVVDSPSVYVYLTSFPIKCHDDVVIDAPGFLARDGIHVVAQLIESRRKLFVVLMHEVGHILKKHLLRMRSVARTKDEMMVFNLAADCVVNLELSKSIKDKILMEVPEVVSRLLNVGLDELRRKSAEEIYFDLLRVAKKLASVSAKDLVASSFGDVSDGGREISSGDEDVASKLAEGDINGVVSEVAMKAYAFQRMAGKGKGFPFEDVIGNEVARVLPWHILLRHELYKLVKKTKYTWARVNRRLPGLVPGYYRVGGIRIWCLVDSSGSISEDEFKLFKKVVADAVSKGAEAYVVFWDSVPSDIYVFNSRSKLRKKVGLSRYGGTLLAPALERIAGKVKSKDVVVVLSDGDIADVTDSVSMLSRIRCAKKILVTVDREIDGFDMVIRVNPET